MESTPEQPDQKKFVSRGGLKLEHALSVFGFNVEGSTCVDLGCSTGGFTDCLLQRGASRVISIDTAYGVIDYKLRVDKRVSLHERTNALHAQPNSRLDLADLVVIDLGWTPQSKAVPAALRWLKPDQGARIITLIKPHYEKSARGGQGIDSGGVIGHEEAETITLETIKGIATFGVESLGCEKSPIVGRKSGKKGKGNAEWLALLQRT